MRAVVAVALLMASTALVVAEPVKPGKLHVVMNEDKEVMANPGDVVEVQIPNPALANRVSELDVTVTGGCKFTGAVEAERTVGGKPVPGGSYIGVFSAVEKGVRSGTISYSYKDGAGMTHKHRVTVKIGGP